MKIRCEDQVQGRLDFAIVDEVDSILIDEARTPLIISGPAHGDAEPLQVRPTAVARVADPPAAEPQQRDRASRMVEWAQATRPRRLEGESRSSRTRVKTFQASIPYMADRGRGRGHRAHAATSRSSWTARGPPDPRGRRARPRTRPASAASTSGRTWSGRT